MRHLHIPRMNNCICPHRDTLVFSTLEPKRGYYSRETEDRVGTKLH